MDFELGDDGRELRRLAAALLDREAAPARVETWERSGDPYDAALWSAMASAGLLGACLPEDDGGAGLGAVELAVILREVGAHAAPVPACGALPAALTVARHGSPGQRARLPAFAEGDLLLTASVREPGASPAEVLTTARRSGEAYVLDGVKTFVPYAEQAAAVLVPARTEDGGVGVFVLEPGELDLTPQPAATGEPVYRAGLDGVRAGPDRLLGPGAHETLLGHATAASAAAVSGALAAALALTTGHVRCREQFGRPLAEFQAVTMRIADVYIAARALDVALWAGVWRLAEGRDDAAEVLAVAAWAACDGALEALHSCQHLHGGLGLDVTYPLHRHFAWVKHHAHLLGGAEARLDAIGALLT
jgi:alkylation response protein AidB-like acyl-CoA dehydrogenase